MSQQIRDELGNVIGDTTMWSLPNNGRSNLPFSAKRQERKTEVSPTWGAEARQRRDENIWDMSLEKLTSSQYPLVGGDGKHSIKFYINVSEESKVIKKGQVRVVNTNSIERDLQNRPDANAGNVNSISNLVALGAAPIGASLVAKDLMRYVKGGVISNGKLYGLTAAGAVSAGVIAGTTTEYVLADYLKVTNKVKRIDTTITLYSPSNIKTDYSFNYDTDRNILADLMTQEGSKSIIEGINSLGAAASAAPRIVAVAANNTVGLLSKTAMNPKQTMMFKEVAPRTFSFEYRFAPRSKEEAAEVAKIIRTFKLYAHPEMIEGYANFLYIYPAEFDIEYQYVDSSGTNVANKNLNKISSCYLERIDVNYGSSGSFQSLANGEPVVTDMILVFREIERLHRDRIMNGY